MFIWDNLNFGFTKFESKMDELSVRANELEFSNKKLKLANQKLLIEVGNLEDQVFDLNKAKDELKKEAKYIKLFYNQKLREKENELEALSCKMNQLWNEKANQKDVSSTDSNLKELKVNYEEFRDQYFNLENSVKASQEMEIELKTELNFIKFKVESELLKNSELLLLFKSSQEKVNNLENVIENLKDEMDLINQKMNKKESEIFQLKQLLNYTDLDYQNFDCKKEESPDEAVDCQENFDDSSFLKSKHFFEISNQKHKTSTVIKRHRGKRKSRLLINQRVKKPKNLWEELKMENPDLVLSFPELYKTLDNESQKFDTNLNLSSFEKCHAHSQLIKTNGQFMIDQSVQVKNQCKFFFSSWTCLFGIMAKRFYFPIKNYFAFWLKLPFRFLFTFSGFGIITYKLVKKTVFLKLF